MFTFIGAGGWSAHLFRSPENRHVEFVREGTAHNDLKEETQLGVQTPRKDCTVVRRQDFGNQNHSGS